MTQHVLEIDVLVNRCREREQAKDDCFLLCGKVDCHASAVYREGESTWDSDKKQWKVKRYIYLTLCGLAEHKIINIIGTYISHSQVCSKMAYVKSVSKVLGQIPKPAAPTLQEDLSQDLWDIFYHTWAYQNYCYNHSLLVECLEHALVRFKKCWSSPHKAKTVSTASWQDRLVSPLFHFLSPHLGIETLKPRYFKLHR